MNPVRWKYLSAVFLLLSASFLSCVVVLPQWKSPQRAVYYGPLNPYIGSGTSLSGYYIPTVDNGSVVTVSVANFIPGALDISIFPTQAGAVAPSGGPVYIKTPLINSTASFRADATQPYGIYIISRNYTKFLLIIQATYSPYFILSNYASVAVGATFATAILFYYYSFTSRRWVVEQRAIKEARGGEGDGR